MRKSNLSRSLVLLLGFQSVLSWGAWDVQFYNRGIKPPLERDIDGLESTLNLSGSKGETLNFVIRVRGEGCFEPKIQSDSVRLSARFYEMKPFHTEHPSYRGAKVGDWLDPLVEKKKFCAPALKLPLWILGEVTIPDEITSGTKKINFVIDQEKHSLSLKVWKMSMPDRPAVPLYTEVTPWYLLLGHHGKWENDEEVLTRAYNRKLSDHRVVPIKNWSVPLEIENGRVKNTDAFKKTVLKYIPDWAWVSIPPPQVGDPAGKPRDRAEYFRAVEKWISHEKWKSRALIYLWDEPGQKEIEELKKLAQVVRKEAPSLKILVTTPYRKDLDKWVDFFVPVGEQFTKPEKKAHYWLYNSCMSHGCDADQSTGTPDWVIDRPEVYIRSMAWVAHEVGVEAVLYYHAVYAYQFYSQGRDPWKNLWDFSGNGDGTLFYPGRPGVDGLTKHEPVESLRLKIWRQSSYDAEYLNWIERARKKPKGWPESVKKLVRSPSDFEKDITKFLDLREAMGDFLNSL